MIKVKNTLNIYEVGGQENKELIPEKLIISSHWNRNEFVNIEIPGFYILTVSAKDLKAAIENATNISRF